MIIMNVDVRTISTVTEIEEVATGLKATERWERSLSIPLDTMRQVIHEELKSLLREGKLIYETRIVSDIEAEAEIKEFLLEKKRLGITKVSIFDIFTSLLLPMEQIERLVEKFENEGRIREVDE